MTLQKTSHNFTKIAFKPLQTNLFNIVLLSFFLVIGCNTLYAQELRPTQKPATSLKQVDSVTITNKAVLLKALDSIPSLDTIKKSIKPKKAILDGKVRYKAAQYAKIDQKNKLITLYDQAELYYQDIELKAGKIVLDYEKNEVYAGRLKDSTGKFTQYPNFKQGANVVEPDSIRFNFKTKKALIYNSRSDQGEFKIKAAITKKENTTLCIS